MSGEFVILRRPFFNVEYLSLQLGLSIQKCSKKLEFWHSKGNLSMSKWLKFEKSAKKRKKSKEKKYCISNARTSHQIVYMTSQHFKFLLEILEKEHALIEKNYDVTVVRLCCNWAHLNRTSCIHNKCVLLKNGPSKSHSDKDRGLPGKIHSISFMGD